MSEHRVEPVIDVDEVSARIVCTAPADAWCRIAPCAHDCDGYVQERDDRGWFHMAGTDRHDLEPRPTDASSCDYVEDIDEHGVLDAYEGAAACLRPGPIVFTWDGYRWTWAYALRTETRHVTGHDGRPIRVSAA